MATSSPFIKATKLSPKGVSEAVVLNKNFFVASTNILTAEETMTRNDCVVRAIMVAKGTTYKEALTIAREVVRWSPKNGARMSPIMKGLPTIGGKLVVSRYTEGTLKAWGFQYPEDVDFPTYNPSYKSKKVSYTLKSFIESHPTGTYTIGVKGHMVALKDGVLYANPNEWHEGLYREVWVAYEFEN